MAEGTFRVPVAAWTHRFDQPLDAARQPGRPTNPGSILKMLPMILRLFRYTRRNRAFGFDPINMTGTVPPGPYQGVPLGGIGAGSIGRGWRGDFRRWQLRPGVTLDPPVMADQFTLFVQPLGGEGRTQVLFPGQPSDGSLAAWRWNLDPRGAQYRALFPRAWTVHEAPLPGVRLACRQLSPVIAQNYAESSYPCAEFRWQIENTGPVPARIGLMFTFQNGMGAENDRAGGHTNQPFTLDGTTGVLLRHAYRQPQTTDPERPAAPRAIYEDPLSFAIAARCEPAGAGMVTYRARITTSGDGYEPWADFQADGKLDNTTDMTPSAPGETIGAALAVTVEVPAGETREVAFSLAWDMPLVRFGYGRAYHRRYTRSYGAVGDAAPRMAVDALLRADEWEALIERWQHPILEDEKLPLWYRQALFNELYYLVDGGTVWCDPLDEPAPDPEMGHFAYLEGHEYRMYNTYDVHFYASFALAQNWPRIELALQRDIAAAVLAGSPEQMTEVYTGKRVMRKRTGCAPHDTGMPYEDPWCRVNAYFLHDVNEWKDLNPKFVLQVYRDYVATGDRQFVLDTWEAVDSALRRAHQFDRDRDGLIENSGFPDQTYDLWTAHGPSAYTGGLWLASLAAGAALAEIAGEPLLAWDYRQLFEQGRRAYKAKLWNGRYFNYDSSLSPQHDSIMADQMAGQWYARACGLPPVVDATLARSALTAVFDWNVQRFHGGRMGAVNGMRPNGRVDRTSLQSQEVWVGTTYAVAAAMLHEGLAREAFHTAQGACTMTYADTGYWFQTPEAWDEAGNYRSIAYMRPLAIWAMQWALERARENAGIIAQQPDGS